MDSKNLFEINFATQHSLDIGIVAPKSGNVDMQLMTDHKVSDFVTKKSYHAVTVVSNYPVKATSDTVSVDPFCCSSNSLLLDTDVLRCELCVIPQHYLRLLAPCCNPKNISSIYHTGMSTNFKYSNPLDASYILDDGALIHTISWVIVWKVYRVFKKETWPNNVLFDGYPGGLSTKNNSHLRWKESSSSNLSYSQQSKWTYGGTYLLGDGMVTPTETD